MINLRVRLQPAVCVALLLMMLASLSCALPILPTSTADPEVTGPVESTPTANTPSLSKTLPAQDIPGEILTEVAATIGARITQEAEAASLSKTPGSPISAAPTASAPQAPAPIVTATPTWTDVPPPPRADSSNPTASPSTTFTQTSPNITIRPPIGGYSDSGFQIRGMNIHWCSGQPWAIFRVRNRSSKPLESLSLLYQDVGAGKTIAGPFVSDAPFMANDKSCISGGIESLSPGSTRYLGNSLGSPILQGHKIRATIILCTGNNLSGTCYQNIADFVMP